MQIWINSLYLLWGFALGLGFFALLHRQIQSQLLRPENGRRLMVPPLRWILMGGGLGGILLTQPPSVLWYVLPGVYLARWVSVGWVLSR